MNAPGQPVIGQTLLRLGEVTSTNDWLESFTTKNTPPEGFTVQADSQTAGKGQFGSSWHSAPGLNLLLSIWLTPRFLPAANAFALARMAALGLYRTLSPQLPSASVKWPNDLLAGDRKIAGILIRTTVQGDQLRSCILGIGLNVNQTRFPPELPRATSLALATGGLHDLEAVRQQLLSELDTLYSVLRTEGALALDPAYASALYRKGQEARFAPAGGPPFPGIIQGVDTAGCLQVLDLNSRQVRLFTPKEIRFL